MRTEGKYILEGREVKEITDLFEWANWFETADRHVKYTKIQNTEVSTIFLGIDMNFWSMFMDKKSPPILFETMIFGGEYDRTTQRYSTYEQAEAGHKEACKKVRQSIKANE